MFQSSSAKHQGIISCYYFISICCCRYINRIFFLFCSWFLSTCPLLLSLAVFIPSSSGKLVVEYMRGQPLCMELFPQLFSSCRIPGPKHDHVVHYGRPRRGPAHITVVRNYQVN